ncbi:MAG: hypothetical protein JWP75_1534 [Frondihabitans sp.]|nr:hypothetical protein [Frondihabitans sp.]
MLRPILGLRPPLGIGQNVVMNPWLYVLSAVGLIVLAISWVDRHKRQAGERWSWSRAHGGFTRGRVLEGIGEAKARAVEDPCPLAPNA